MKKLLLLFFFSIFFLNSQGQTSVYHPFPDSGIVWREEYGGLGLSKCCCGGNCIEYKHYQYFLEGDTSIGAYTYKKVFQTGKQILEISGPPSFPICSQCSDTININAEYVGGIRQDTAQRKVFFISSLVPATDTLLYDFNLKVGDTLSASYLNYPHTSFVSSIDSILIGNSFYKRFWLSNGTNALIEGIGGTNGLLFPLGNCFEFCNNLVCVTINSIPIYPDTATVCALVSGITTISLENSISIFPNPASDKITISNYPFSGKEARVEIYNMMGEKLQTINFKPESAVDVSNLAAGVYLVEVGDGEKTYRSKIIKQ